MSDFHEIWKWDDAQQRLEFSRKYTQAGQISRDVRMERMVEENARLRGALAGRDVQGELNEKLRQELQIVRGLLDAKTLECARLQKRVEELEKAK